MKLLYLGTAAAEAIPALFCECEACQKARSLGRAGVRGRAGSLLDGVLKIDFGPDSYRQMLDNGLSYAKIHSVLITHTHEDHLAVDELALRRQVTAHIHTEPKLMTVYGNAAVGEKLRGKTGEMLAFSEIKPFTSYDIEGYTVTPLEAVHCCTAEGQDFPVVCRGKLYHRSENALIFLIEKGGKRLLYAHDTDELTAEDLDFLRGKHLDLASLDCTNGILQSKWTGHMGADRDKLTRQALLDCGAADEKTLFVANHFSHNGFPGEEELQEALPGFLISHDGMEIEF